LSSRQWSGALAPGVSTLGAALYLIPNIKTYESRYDLETQLQCPAALGGEALNMLQSVKAAAGLRARKMSDWEGHFSATFTISALSSNLAQPVYPNLAQLICWLLLRLCDEAFGAYIDPVNRSKLLCPQAHVTRAARPHGVGAAFTKAIAPGRPVDLVDTPSDPFGKSDVNAAFHPVDIDDERVFLLDH